MDLRPYLPGDREACLAVFDSHGPQALTAADRARFEEFLDSFPSEPAGPYFVLEHDGGVVGCGGYSTITPIEREEDCATLTWGIVHRDFQRLGLGRFLLLYRLREIGKLPQIRMVLAAIPQPAAPFFASQGFREIPAERSFDRVHMLKKLSVCA